MDKKAVSKALQERLGLLFGVPSVDIVVSWDTRKDKPIVKIPSRLSTVLFTQEQQRDIIQDSIDIVLRQQLHELADTTDLSDEELKERLRALRD